MNSILDASALLAWLQREPGADITELAILNGAAISAVNWAEVLEKAIAHNINIDNLDGQLAESGLSFIDFNRRQANIAADLRQKTKAQGLSLGDRACLALAIHLNLPVLTADKIWQQLNIGVSVRLIR